MEERKPEFSDYEKQAIATQAREIANMGRVGGDVIHDLVRAKILLMQWAIQWNQSDDLKVYFENPEAIHHEIDVITGVIEQSRLLMQMAGTDDLSILDRHAQKGGLGSIFDPESKISKDLKEKGLDLFSD